MTVDEAEFLFQSAREHAIDVWSCRPVNWPAMLEAHDEFSAAWHNRNDVWRAHGWRSSKGEA